MYIGSGRPTLTNVIFNGNSATRGGGLCNIEGDPTLTNVTFSGNFATESGGGMYIWAHGHVMDNGILWENHSRSFGPQAHTERNGRTLTNVTFSGNSAGEYGGGLFCDWEGFAILSNCILWGNTAPSNPQFSMSSGPVNISYSLVQGGCVGASCSHIIDANPQFVRDPDPGDGDWATLADNDYGDLSLLPGSPAIDAGDNTAIPSGITTDLRGSLRRFDVPFVADTGNGTTPIVDMGAYEASWQYRVFLPLVPPGSD